MSTALGIQNNGSVGTTASDLRGIFAWEWATTGTVSRFNAGFVTTGKQLAYHVEEGLAIVGRGGGYGLVKAYWPGGDTPSVQANASGNPRLDAIYIEAHDVTQGDADNLVYVGVAQGTPAATPQVPAIPSGAELLQVRLMPAGASTTASSTLYQLGPKAIPFSTSMGILVNATDTTNSDADAAGTSWSSYAQGTFTLPSARIVDIKRVFTLASKTGKDASVYTRVLIDGEQVDYCEIEAHAAILATSQYVERTITLPAGTHTVQAQMRAGVEKARKYWSADGWAGQTLQVVDAGIAYEGED